MNPRFARRTNFIRRTDTPIGDELERVTEGETHRTSAGRHRGGEWDAWYHLPLRTRQRITGAGYARRYGRPPDELADIITHNKPDVADDPLGWFYRQTLRALTERRQAARRDRRLRLAAAHGHRTEYEYRVAQARAAGFDTFWQYRQHRWKEPGCPLAST